jgi:hypothetical protein
MRRGSGRGKGRRAAARGRTQRREGSIGCARVWGGAQPLERASGWGVVSSDGGRDGTRRPRQRWATEARAPARGQAATGDCRRRKLSPRGAKEELFLLTRV